MLPVTRVPSQLSRALRPTYYRLNFRRQRIGLYRHWRRTRSSFNPSFFPAVRSYNLSTPAYVQSLAAKNTGATCLSIPDADYFRPAQPKTIGDNPLGHQIVPTNPPLFVAKLSKPRVYGDAGDVITSDDVLLPDISFRYVVDLWRERGEHVPLECQLLPPAEPLPGHYALLTSRYGGENYFHWLYNVLPRVALLERAGIPLDNLKLLVNRLQFDVMRETLRVLNISLDQLVEMHNSNVIQPESVLVMPNFLRTGHRRRWYLDWLRGHFLRDVPAGKPTRRLYLSRADAKYRRVANEDQVMNFLAPLGFEKIIIGERSIFEQSALFAQAETVFASHTTAFANILFCSPGARVIDFIAADRLRTYMYELAATMGLDYYYAFLEWSPTSNQRVTHMEETMIPLDRLQAILRHAKIN